MIELTSALPISGAPYRYLLNISTKNLSMLGASLFLLNVTSTSVVAAATAASYLSGEVKLPFPAFVGAIFVFFILGAVGLSGIKESARIALGILALHVSAFKFLRLSRVRINGFYADVYNGNTRSHIHGCMGKSRQRPTTRQLESRTSAFYAGSRSPDIQRDMYRNARSNWIRVYPSLHPTCETWTFPSCPAKSPLASYNTQRVNDDVGACGGSA